MKKTRKMTVRLQRSSSCVNCTPVQLLDNVKHMGP